MDSRAKHAPRPKVLSIDSSTSNQKLIEQALASEFELKTTGSGAQSLDTVRTFAPDVILLDLDLPNSESLKLCRLIRAEALFAQTPILFLTHMQLESEQFKGFAAGGDDYVAKPINTNQLLTKLTLSLDRAHKKNQTPCASEADPHPSLDLNVQYLHEYLLALLELDQTRRLGDLMLNTLDSFGLKGALYWHATAEIHSSIGPLTDLETVLLQQATQSFPVDHSARFVWGSAHFGAIIHNMPSPRSVQYKSMRQLVTTLFKAASTKLQKQQAAPALAAGDPQFGDLAHVVDLHALTLHGFKFEAAVENLESQSEDHLRRISQVLQTFANDETRDDFDRQQFQKLLNQCIQTRIAIYDQCLELQTQLRQIQDCLGVAELHRTTPNPN